jgi:hypothetical protein
VKRFVMLAAILTACVPAATVPIQSETPSATASVVIAASPAAPAITASAAPSPTVATSTDTPTPAPPTDSPAPAPRVTPVPPLTTAPPPVATGPVHNDGQKIIAAFDPPQRWFFGEASASAATQIGSYSVNGVSLAGSAMKCTTLTLVSSNNVCAAIEIIPSVRLQNGVRYELRLLDAVIGSFTARGLIVATPRVVSISATQFDLTVKFDRPMLHVGACGIQSWTLATPGTIEYVRASAQVFPAPVGAYTSSSAAYRDFLTAFVSGADISDDCTTVKLGSGWGGPTGTFDITVSGVEDEYGNFVQPRTFTVDIPDQGPPKLMFAQLELQTAEKKVIRVAYSEAMSEEYVTDPERYYLNGKLIASTTQIECELANCAWVRLTFPPTTFAYGADNTLIIVGVRDTAGNEMTPNIATSGTFQVR